MKHSIRYFLTIACSLTLLVGLFSGCKKDDNNKDNNKEEQPTDFFPMTAGSWWIMKSDTAKTKITATDKDTTIQGRQYKYFNEENLDNGHTHPMYYAKGDNYYRSAVVIEQDETQYIPIIVCPTKPKQGDSWTDSATVSYGPISNAKVTINGKIITTDTSLSAYGKTYDNVIFSHNDIKANILGNPTNVGTLKVGLVKGIGVVYYHLDMSVLTYTQKEHKFLIDYHINK